MLPVLAAYFFCCLMACSGNRKVADDELVCRPIAVEGGYGYIILCGKDTMIYQPFIPAVGGHTPFDSKEDAMKVGRIVYDKMFEGGSPMVTVEEVREALRSE